MEGTDAPWPDDRSRLAPLRQHTHCVWRGSAVEAEARRALRDLPQWREPLAIWRRLWRLMPPDARDDDAQGTRRSVRRACSSGVSSASARTHVWRPTHPLKVRKGCWVVAYCSDKYQMSDWEQGEHRGACRRQEY
ncbi:hypothetical protein PsYK624_063820 [Phanerochaete sordida]|uniref:MYND-type domain-containing protein n=1 Tax=Phanerochaete sordida TaxID=48140 RepID=A0A9P3LDE3_9APHY|nr:hypothetical protein PsYK624_063820 [Phanerochaete sordida]